VAAFRRRRFGTLWRWPIVAAALLAVTTTLVARLGTGTTSPNRVALAAATSAPAPGGPAAGRPRHHMPRDTGPLNPVVGTAPARHANYYGGKVVSNVSVVQVLYGTGTYLPQTTSSSAPSVASFYAGVTASSYIDWLAEYDTTVSGGTNQVIGRGTFAGSTQITPSPANGGTSLVDSQVQAELAAQLAAGHLPAPTTDASGNPDTVYAVYFPHGTSICLPGAGCSLATGGFCAYHSTFTTNGVEVYYSVHPDLTGTSGCGTGTDFANTTAVASHELIEAVTDPEVGLVTSFGPPLSWYDPNYGEIGDICNANNTTVTVGGQTYAVQKGWSNLAGACIASRPVTATAGEYSPVVPFRILDTRNGTGAPTGPVGPAHTLSFSATGHGGVPSTGVSAVALNLTITDPTAAGYLTAWPTGATQPLASVLNWAPGDTRADAVIVPVGSAGDISLYNSAGSTDLIADVVGWFTDGTTAAQSRYNPLVPTRILDTRNGTGAPTAVVGPAATLTFTVAGVGGVPANATAVAMNLTVTDTTAASYLTAWPAGATQPLASVLNWATGATVPNLAIIPVGKSGQVSVFNSAGSTDVIADVVGYFGPVGVTTGDRLTPLTPARILDTRNGTGGPTAPIGPAATRSVTVLGVGGVPASGVGAVVLTVTVTNTTAPSFLTTWPAGATMPLASTLNWVAGQTAPNLDILGPGTAGQVSLYNNVGSTDAVADVSGWFNDGSS